MNKKATPIVPNRDTVDRDIVEFRQAWDPLPGTHEDLEVRLRFESLIADLSMKFINLPANQIDSEIEESQRLICHCLGLDLSSLWQQSDRSPALVLTHLYQTMAGLPTPGPMDYHAHFPWCLQQLLAGKVVAVSSLEDLSAGAARDQEVYRHFGIKSALVIPLSAGGESLIGILSFGDMKEERPWSEALVKRLQTVAQIFTNAINRKRSDQALHESEDQLKDRLRFEEFLTDLSAKFINQPPDRIDGVIEESLQKLVEALGHDRSSLAQFQPDQGHAMVTHACAVPGVEPFSVGVVIDDYVPWYVGEVRKGKTVFLKCLPEDLPPAAAKERQVCKAQGIKSSVAIPLKVGGTVLGVISFTFLRRHCEWSPGVVSRLQMIGEIFANALMRQRSDVAIRAALAENEQLRDRLERENVYLRDQITLDTRVGNPSYHHGRIIGKSRALKKVLAEAERVADTDTSVLIFGETGTGKELLAQTIHELSSRRDRAMVIVNCASLPATLIESELFGREAGAYTGAASAQVGRFAIADGSTLFLDEIGEFPVELQAKLLRVLEDGRFERLGNPKSVTVNVRIIAATNRDLEQAVRDGEFRADLYHRLNVFPIRVPPLREHREDIPLLAWAFVEAFGRRMGKTIKSIPRKTIEQLQQYSWPGNIRELSNVLERAMILTNDDTLCVEMPSITQIAAPLQKTLKESERAQIVRVLQETGWRIRGAGGAAEILGIKPTTLEARMAKLGIKRGQSNSINS